MSPTLALIVQREAEIDTFKPVPFYTVALELPGLTVSGAVSYTHLCLVFMGHDSMFTGRSLSSEGMGIYL